jgi:hypothetical protein
MLKDCKDRKATFTGNQWQGFSCKANANYKCLTIQNNNNEYDKPNKHKRNTTHRETQKIRKRLAKPLIAVLK